MQLTVKDLKSVTHEFTDVDCDQLVSDFAQQVKQKYNYPDGVRLIYSGRILDQTKKMSEYFTNMNNGYVVCMPEKTKNTTSAPASTPTSTPASVPASTPASVPASTPISASAGTPAVTNNTYSVEQVHAMMMVFTRFIKASPDIFYMFSTNDAQFQQFMLSPIFMSGVLQPIASSSTDIMNAIQNGTDINVPIPLFGNTTSGLTPTTSTTPSTGPTQTTGESPLEPLTSPFDNSTTLSQDDHKNIDELCQLGFDKTIVTQAYVMAGKNKDLTASMLFEFM